MRITNEQLKLINSLRCERLSSCEDNLRLVEGFYSQKNNNVAEVLLNDAYREDEDGSVAYYVIKDQEDNILFFFSLKCGLLFDEFIEGEKLVKLKSLCSFLSRKLITENLSQAEIKSIKNILENVRSKKGIKRDDVAKLLGTTKDSEEIDSIFDKNIKNVGKTFAGIEIVHFCANDEYHDKWNSNGLPRSLGTIVFWHFIVPKVIELRKIVGCEYLFLFAADNDPDERLVNYYSNRLRFKKADEHSTAMPIYDFTCKFMYQDAKNLDVARQKFYDNFNSNVGR